MLSTTERKCGNWCEVLHKQSETTGDCLQLLGRSLSLQPEQMICREMCLLGWEVFIWNSHKIDQWAGFGPCSSSGYMSGCAVVPQMTIFFFFVVGRGWGSSATWHHRRFKNDDFVWSWGMGLRWLYMNDAHRMISLQETFWNVLENTDLHQNWGWE